MKLLGGVVRDGEVEFDSRSMTSIAPDTADTT